MAFTIEELYWRDIDDPDYIKVIEMLNTLSEDQESAVRMYAQSLHEQSKDPYRGNSY
jgi:hypothetical protein